MTAGASPKKTGLSIIAGGGTMPVKVAEAAVESGRHVHIFGINGAAEPIIEEFPHSWINFAQIGKILSVSRKTGCSDMVIAGGVRRPRFSDLHPDFGAVINLPFILGWVVGGDNSVLSGIIGFFESKGFRVLGAHEIAPDLIAGEGVFSRRKPGRTDREDIEVGLNVIAALGALDVGQATVVAHKYVLAVEAAEGTDRMLQRCKDLNKWGKSGTRKRSGVLVKCAKPGQERRIDLPTVGPDTVKHASDAGLAGIAIAANDVLILERDKFIQAADDAGMFVIGVQGNADGAT